MLDLLVRAVAALETIARELVRARGREQRHREGSEPRELDPARCDALHCLYCCACAGCTADRQLVRLAP